jgi:hypothetical protein
MNQTSSALPDPDPTPETDQEYYTTKEVARKLRKSLSTASRRFRDLPGVVDLGQEGGNSELLIPKSVFDKYVKDHTNPPAPPVRKK